VAQLVYSPLSQVISPAGVPISGALLYVYNAQSTTPRTTYSDIGLATQNANPLIADGAGRFGPIYLASTGDNYKLVLHDANDAHITTRDDIPVSPISQFSQAELGAILYPRTAGEISASVTPVNYTYPPGHLLRYGTNTTPGTTDMSTALQAAVDSATSINPVIYLTDDVGIAKPILIRTTTTQNLTIQGTGRTSTNLRPLAADIKQAAQNINSLFINQNNNGHVHFRGFRCIDGVAYTGIFFDALEGGGADGLGQASFSMLVEDMWFAFSSNNTGIFHGGFSDFTMTHCDAESVKDAVMKLEGAGNGGHKYIDNVLNACFDSFIRQVDDGNPINTIQVVGLQVINHMRGRIFDLTEATNVTVSDVHVEWNASFFTPTWLCRLEECVDVRFSNCIESTASGTVRGNGGIDIVNANTVSFDNMKITAEVGLRVQGTGAIDVSLNNCDLIGCQYAFQQLSGTLSGKLRFVNCRLNDSDEYAMLHSAGTPSFSIDFIGGEVVNAGMTAIATSRNINLDTSGDVVFDGTLIGQNSGDADAACYFRTDGSGAFRVLRPRLIGTPPTSVVDASSTQAVHFTYEAGYGGVLASAATVTLPNFGDVFQISGTTNITSVGALNQQGRTVKFMFQGILTFTDGSNLKLDAGANLVTTADDSITLFCPDGTNWIESGRSVA
jgi:hypothetical protein